VGRVVPFSDFQKYVGDLRRRPDFFGGAILDTNILIAMSYEVKKEHEWVSELLDIALEEGFRLFATVTTKSEFIEFHRRLVMTESLIDLADPHSEIKIHKAGKAAINVATGSMRANAKRGGDPVFTDTQLKNIKRSFSAGPHSGYAGWLKICKEILSGKLSEIVLRLNVRDVEYVSPHDPQTNIFNRTLEWDAAIKLSEMTNISVSDAMILNALHATKCPFIISLDFDIGYAALSDSAHKDVVMPDNDVREFRNYHFPST
jgi:hypothetical protein